MRQYLICYDIPNNRRRRHVARLLEGYGYRLHESAFLMTLQPGKLGRLKRRLTLALNAAEDHVVTYPVCERDQVDVVHLGRSEAPPGRASVVV